MRSSRQPRTVPLRYDDGFRGAIAMLVSLVGALAVVLLQAALLGVRDRSEQLLLVFSGTCLGLTLFSIVYLVWTHALFARSPRDELLRIASEQFRTGPGTVSRLLGFGGTESWALSAAAAALVFSVAALALDTGHEGPWLPILVVLTAATSWAMVVYAFALRYLRLHAAGERIDFDIEEPPVFTDFVSMAVMVSSVAAMSAGTPRTRMGLNSVRTHTFIAFAFNALVVAMVVSLLTTFVAGS